MNDCVEIKVSRGNVHFSHWDSNPYLTYQRLYSNGPVSECPQRKLGSIIIQTVHILSYRMIVRTQAHFQWRTL
jgi:hypothetical protein